MRSFSLTNHHVWIEKKSKGYITLTVLDKYYIICDKVNLNKHGREHIRHWIREGMKEVSRLIKKYGEDYGDAVRRHKEFKEFKK